MVSFGRGGGSRSSPASVWDVQTPFLQNLYGQAQGLAGGQAGIGAASQNLVNSLMGGMGDWANNTTNPAIANLMQRAQGGSPWLQQQIGNLGTNISQNLNQQILPSLARYSTTAGGYGGGRMGVDMGQQAQYAQQQFQQGATGLYANDYNQGLQAALGAGQLGVQGVGAAQGQYNLGMSPFAAQWMPYQQLAGMIGSPTVLGGGSHSGGQFGINVGNMFGFG